MSKVLMVREVELEPIEGSHIVSEPIDEDSVSWKFIEIENEVVSENYIANLLN